MVVLSGADLVLPAGVKTSATLVIEDDIVVEIQDGARAASSGTTHVALEGHTIVPGFIDVHVHGVEGVDVLDGTDATARIARSLPRFGVTAFCPTTVACSPQALRGVLESVGHHRAVERAVHEARVLPAHLESNFINPDYCGAQPVGCIRTPPKLPLTGSPSHIEGEDFTAEEVLAEIERGTNNVGIVTLAPELDRALHLIQHLVRAGKRVSLGHSGATLEQSQAAIRMGARQATHLFNRMPPLSHREPGLAGAVLTSDEIAAELICDGVHLHEATVRMAVAAKGAGRVMAITDGTAAAGLPEGARARLGGRPLVVANGAARLEDGTMAGSIATMDKVFRFLVRNLKMSLPDAVRLSSATAASELGLRNQGRLAVGALADLVVLDSKLDVVQTYIGGRLAYSGRWSSGRWCLVVGP